MMTFFLFLFAGGAAGGGYSQVIPMEEVILAHGPTVCNAQPYIETDCGQLTWKPCVEADVAV